jgi:hypothetical protein
MFDAFDAGKRKARGHEVQAYHGRVAEAVFRRWLADFLPKRFGVTSGYVVSQGQRGEVKFPHYDLIVYNYLDAPILWVEGHPDLSEDGKSRAIPVEHVRAVLEVKATYGSGEAKDAVEHLRDLAPFYSGIDHPRDNYKKYLPPNFFCGAVFFDATEAAQKSEAAARHLIPIDGPRSFFGGIILRGEGKAPEESGRIMTLKGEEAGQVSLSTMTVWMVSAFSMFAFDLVAILNGTYNPMFLSSMHAVYVPP